MESKVNVISDSEHEVSVKLDYEEIKDNIDEAYLKEKKNIALPGFRKGKVPLQMIKKIYGDSIEYKASEDIANNKFWEIVKQENLKPISTPKLMDLNYDKGKSLSFTIRYEVMPKIEPKDYKNLEIEKPVFKVKEEDIEADLKSILKKEASFEEAETIENEDYRITVDLQLLKKDGTVNEEAQKQKDVVIYLNDEQAKTDIAEKAKGKKVGDEFEFNYIHEQKHGDHVHTYELNYKAVIKKIEKFVFPEWTEELCKKVSNDNAKNLEELKEYFRNEYKKYFERESEKIYEESLLSKISENNPVELPKDYTEYVLENLVKYELDRAKQDGYGNLDKNALKQSLRSTAEWQVKWDIISKSIAEAENIEVTDDDLKKMAEEESQRTGISVDKLVKYYKESNQKEKMLEKKVLDFLKENNPPKEIDADEIKKREEKKKAEAEKKEAKKEENK